MQFCKSVMCNSTMFLFALDNKPLIKITWDIVDLTSEVTISTQITTTFTALFCNGDSFLELLEYLDNWIFLDLK